MAVATKNVWRLLLSGRERDSWPPGGAAAQEENKRRFNDARGKWRDEQIEGKGRGEEGKRISKEWEERRPLEGRRERRRGEKEDQMEELMETKRNVDRRVEGSATKIKKR